MALQIYNKNAIACLVPHRINENLVRSTGKIDIKFYCPTDNCDFSRNSPELLGSFQKQYVRNKPSSEYITCWLLKDKRNRRADFCLLYLGMMKLMKVCLLYDLCSLISRLVNN